MMTNIAALSETVIKKTSFQHKSFVRTSQKESLQAEPLYPNFILLITSLRDYTTDPHQHDINSKSPHRLMNVSFTCNTLSPSLTATNYNRKTFNLAPKIGFFLPFSPAMKSSKAPNLIFMIITWKSRINNIFRVLSESACTLVRFFRLPLTRGEMFVSLMLLLFASCKGCWKKSNFGF